MFQDALLLKTQLFHTVWPAVDIIPYASMADSALDMSLGANSSVNYYPVSSESTAAWNYGANFAKGDASSSWTSGAKSLTAGSWDKDTPTTNGGMYGVYFVADPSYAASDGGFGNSTNYPQNGNYIVGMCHDADTTCRG
eukprot:Tamp_30380.p1 GENE.Tamp_30380~~Tamp_30380.p1  ORF type:complete len:146 (+),score=32.41 Tamp_30380:23-439(+)